MSILTSLFGSKKRAKKGPLASPGSTSPPMPSASKPKPRASSPTDRPHGPDRFATVRRRSSAVAGETSARRNSGDQGRRKQLRAGETGPGKEWELPTLEFDDGVANGSGQTAVRSSGLGLEEIGRRPVLSAEDRDAMQSVSLTAQEVGRIWKSLGAVLKHVGQLDHTPSGTKADYF
jgi:hypothetical protein